jgi:maltooligosyltrehalose trehalohydrolase
VGWQPFLGAFWQHGRPLFRVWAPEAKSVQLVLEPAGGKPERSVMEKEPEGFFCARGKTARPGDLYRFQIDGQALLPDPASRCQPEGVHGPSQVTDPSAFVWSDDSWEGVKPERLALYELHVGTFTPPGTFSAAMDRLPFLRDLGVTAIELMPVADFPGARNWGYDGVSLFAPARCYGTPDDLRRFADTAHKLGLAVHLDVVYNHLGPDGSYLAAFSPFFLSQRHRSPWGAGINYDGPHSEIVRRFFIESALHWVHEYHIDGLRLDATHAIVDESPRHFLADLTEAIESSMKGEPRKVVVIAEDDRNLSIMAMPRSVGGRGLDATWADDFHHQVHRCLTGESDGYFADFSGTTADIASTVRQGWFYCGQHAPYFGKNRGTDPSHLPPSAFVVCLQNHDQVGNRAWGDRLNHLIDLPSYRAASVLLLLAPEIPLLFMGQEWASSSPFQYFTDHSPDLGRRVTEGRRREFARFASFRDPAARQRIPDPQDPSTFTRSRLAWEEVDREPHAGVLRLHKALLHLRSNNRAMADSSRSGFAIVPLGEDSLLLCRRSAAERLLAVIQLRQPGTHDLREHSLAELPRTLAWNPVLTTEDPAFATRPAPLELTLQPLRVSFARPGAIILRSTQAPSAGGDIDD